MGIRKHFLALGLILGCTVPIARAADVALVDDGLGQALLFVHNGLCYAALPNHVSALRARIALAVPNPRQAGAAEIFWRDPDTDLAFAFVEGDLAGRCTVTLNSLRSDISQVLQSNETGFVKSVHSGGGFFDRMGVSLVDVRDGTFYTIMNDFGVEGELTQGFSGALVTVGGRLAGIAISNEPSSREAQFLRMDRLAALASANLSGNHPVTRTIPEAHTGAGFRVTAFEGGARAGATSLEPGSLTSPWIAEWTGEPISFEITLSQDSMVPVNLVALRTQLSDETTPPRRIVIEVDRGLPGAPFWSPLASPDMSPTGQFDLVTGGTVARRVRVSIMDVWLAGRPLRLDTLWVE